MSQYASDLREPEVGMEPESPARLSRRGLTIIVCGLLLAGLLILAALLPVPYVTLQPGPTENTLGAYDGVDVIVIDHETYPTEGNLDLTTVSVTSADSELNLLEALWDWADPNRAVVPREDVYSDEETLEEIQARNAEQMETSQQNAIAAGLQQVGIDVPERVFVVAITEGAPALGHLEAGDVILAVDGEEIATPEDVSRLVTAHEPGETVAFTVERDGATIDVEVPTIESATPEKRTVVGIAPGVAYDPPFDVTITLGEDIGGPSAGLMFSLGIVDKLTPGSLTDGRHVAGTGVIDGDGVVGPIGGIQQKIAGAKDAGATIFLVPADNCPAAAAAEFSDIRMVRVETLSGAVAAIEALTSGSPTDAAAVPTCE